MEAGGKPLAFFLHVSRQDEVFIITFADIQKLLSSGDTAAAISALEAAAEANDPDALMRLAVWRMSGEIIARDLQAAQVLLRRATEAGHRDAALMQVALTANGSGGVADWGAASNLLEAAAKTDSLAAQHRRLLAAMSIDDAGMPLTKPVFERLSNTPMVAISRGFLSPAECEHIALAVRGILEPSMVVDPRHGGLRAHPIRTSHGAAIGPTRETLPIQAILRRIAALSGTDVEQGEPLTVLHYSPGQEYRPHYDALPGLTSQRKATVLLYLNQGYTGGETRFTHNGLTVAGRGGDALIFRNTGPDGRRDPTSQHAGMPVTAGTKWLATRWIRDGPVDPWSMG